MLTPILWLLSVLLLEVISFSQVSPRDRLMPRVRVGNRVLLGLELDFFFILRLCWGKLFLQVCCRVRVRAKVTARVSALVRIRFRFDIRVRIIVVVASPTRYFFPPQLLLLLNFPFVSIRVCWQVYKDMVMYVVRV
jgi:hypothetical protein